MAGQKQQTFKLADIEARYPTVVQLDISTGVEDD